MLKDDLRGDGAHPSGDIVTDNELDDLVNSLGELRHGISNRCPVFGGLLLSTLAFGFGPGMRTGELSRAEIMEQVSRGLTGHTPAMVSLSLVLLLSRGCGVDSGIDGVEALTTGIEYGEGYVGGSEGEE